MHAVPCIRSVERCPHYLEYRVTNWDLRVLQSEGEQTPRHIFIRASPAILLHILPVSSCSCITTNPYSSNANSGGPPQPLNNKWFFYKSGCGVAEGARLQVSVDSSFIANSQSSAKHISVLRLLTASECGLSGKPFNSCGRSSQRFWQHEQEKCPVFSSAALLESWLLQGKRPATSAMQQAICSP